MSTVWGVVAPGRIATLPCDAIPREPADGAIVVDAHGLAWQRDDTCEPLVALPPRWYPTTGLRTPPEFREPLSWPALVATRGPLLVLAETGVSGYAALAEREDT